jgi:DNA invertase Pin-like site-specific DNA recombinase
MSKAMRVARVIGQPTRPRFVGYVRVSTDRQGRSGLGLEAQEECVRSAVAARGGVVVAWFTEVETGKRADRPELAKAMAHARRAGAALVCAKLDPMARKASFLLALVESGLPILFCDLPEVTPDAAGKAHLGFMAVMAEYEAGVCSQRTRTALAAYKARGGKLGSLHPRCKPLSPEARAKGQAAAAAVAKAKAARAYADLEPELRRLRAAGCSLTQITGILNGGGHTTATGALWSSGQVCRVLKRLVAGGVSA